MGRPADRAADQRATVERKRFDVPHRLDPTLSDSYEHQGCGFGAAIGADDGRCIPAVSETDAADADLRRAAELLCLCATRAVGSVHATAHRTGRSHLSADQPWRI